MKKFDYSKRESYDYYIDKSLCTVFWCAIGGLMFTLFLDMLGGSAENNIHAMYRLCAGVIFVVGCAYFLRNPNLFVLKLMNIFGIKTIVEEREERRRDIDFDIDD